MIISSTTYSRRNASIGFKFAALYDGKIPNTIPINIENNTAKIEASTLIAIGVPFNFDIKNASITPEITPITPPVDVRTTASVKN